MHSIRFPASQASKLVIAALASSIIFGCQSSDNKSVTTEKNFRDSTVRTSTNGAPSARPMGGWSGRILSINSKLRFVVIDFSLNQMPPNGRVMSVYRAGTKVGEVRLGAQTRGDLSTAEILEGELQFGDEARAD